MTRREIEEWNRHKAMLLDHVREFARYDGGYTLRQKEKFSKQRIDAIRKIKNEVLGYEPFREIVKNVAGGTLFAFDEDYDDMGWDIRRVIRIIEEKEFANDER